MGEPLGARDPWVVSSKQLAAYIERFCVAMDREGGFGRRFDAEGNERVRFSSRELGPLVSGERFGAVQFLCQEANISQRRVWAIFAGETTWTEFRVADRLLTAMGYQHMLHTGEIELVPNPRITEKSRARSLELV